MAESKLGDAGGAPYLFAGDIDAALVGRRFDLPAMAGSGLVTMAQIAEITQGMGKGRYHEDYLPMMNNYLKWYQTATKILGDPEDRKFFPGFSPDPDGVQMLATYLTKKAIEYESMEKIKEILTTKKAETPTVPTSV